MFVQEIKEHIDSKGRPKPISMLLYRRANRAVKWLIKQGNQLSRLTARVYDETRPIESKRTSSKRALNICVEYVRSDSFAVKSSP